MIRQAKINHDNNLNSAKVFVIDPTKGTECLGNLNGFEISKDGYYRALLVPKDEDLELHLKQESNSKTVSIFLKN